MAEAAESGSVEVPVDLVIADLREQISEQAFELAKQRSLNKMQAGQQRHQQQTIDMLSTRISELEAKIPKETASG